MKDQLFADYPDVVDIGQMRKMLGDVGNKTAYRLLHEGRIRYLKIGRGFRIPKASVIQFVKETIG